MHTTSTNTLQSRSNDTLISTRFVRTGGAADAQGFAQIMQAFDSQSELAQSIEQSQESDQASARDAEDQIQKNEDAESDENTDQSVNSKEQATQSTDASDSQSTQDGEIDQQVLAESIPNPSSESGASGSTEQSTSSQGDDGLVVRQEPVEGSKAEDAAMRLLENQSEQAKLTIKGLTRSLTHAAETNLADIAVKTRLHSEAGVESQAQPKQTTPESVASEPKPVVVAPQSHTASIKVIADSQAQVNANHDPALQRPVDARADQTGVEVQQVKGQRSDAASMVAQASASGRTTDSSAINTNTGQVAGGTRTPSQQVVRAVSGVESGNVGNNRAGTEPNALVEKMKATELPSETRRAAVLAQVQRGLASMLRSGKSEMTLRLTPGHLGEVRIHIKSDGDQLAIRFETTSREATDHLNASVKELSMNLRAKGINLEQVQVEQASDEDTSPTASKSDFNSSSADQSDQHNQDSNQRNAQHRDDRQPGIEPGADTPVDEPEPIWTELGLDAIA